MKAFRSDLDETVRFRIEPRNGEPGIYLELKENGRTATTVFPAEYAPALAVAIFEAAYVTAQNAPERVSEAWAKLYALATEETVRAAEARELAELEAEALELFKAAYPAHAEWEWPTVPSPDKWLAVARRAREMRAEK